VPTKKAAPLVHLGPGHLIITIAVGASVNVIVEDHMKPTLAPNGASFVTHSVAQRAQLPSALVPQEPPGLTQPARPQSLHRLRRWRNHCRSRCRIRPIHRSHGDQTDGACGRIRTSSGNHCCSRYRIRTTSFLDIHRLLLQPEPHRGHNWFHTSFGTSWPTCGNEDDGPSHRPIHNCRGRTGLHQLATPSPSWQPRPRRFLRSIELDYDSSNVPPMGSDSPA
jgi:hypothetical protein